MISQGNKVDKSGVESVDIGDHLPHRIKKDMKRNDGTKFKVVHCTENAGDNEVRLDGKVRDLVHWATERGVAGLVEGTVRKYLGEDEDQHSEDDGGDGTATVTLRGLPASNTLEKVISEGGLDENKCR